MFFHQGAPALGDGALRTDRDLEALRAAAAAHLSPAGQLQVATALDMLAALEARLDGLRHRLLAAGSLTGAVWSSDRKGPPGRLSRQGPAVLRWAVYEAGKTHARTSAPDHGYYAAVKDRKNSKRAALSEARKIVRQACHILTELGDDAFTKKFVTMTACQKQVATVYQRALNACTRAADVPSCMITFIARELGVPLGGWAGALTPQAAAWTGLPAGIAGAVGNVDAHGTPPAATHGTVSLFQIIRHGGTPRTVLPFRPPPWGT